MTSITSSAGPFHHISHQHIHLTALRWHVGAERAAVFFFHAHKHTRLTGRNGRSRVTCVCRVVGLYSLLMLSILHKESCRRSDGRDFCTVRRPVVCQSHARSLLHRSLPCVCVCGYVTVAAVTYKEAKRSWHDLCGEWGAAWRSEYVSVFFFFFTHWDAWAFTAGLCLFDSDMWVTLQRGRGKYVGSKPKAGIWNAPLVWH